MFVTYSLLIASGKYGTRLDQIVEWAGGEDFNGCMILDEGHKVRLGRPHMERVDVLVSVKLII